MNCYHPTHVAPGFEALGICARCGAMIVLPCLTGTRVETALAVRDALLRNGTGLHGAGTLTAEAQSKEAATRRAVAAGKISAAEADALIADLWEGVIAWAAEQTDAAWWIARRAWTLAAFIDGWYAEYATDDEEA